ncbi:MAG: hypothetical protein WCI73_14465 [Phycisphaerae bacterium]
MSLEITGRWEELVARSEFRGHQVKITVMDEPALPPLDSWLESLREMARNGIRITRPVDDSRTSVYPETV